MASNIDFASAAYDPAKIFGQGDDYVNRIYQYAAKRDAGNLYAQGDTAGASRRLAQSGDLTGAITLDTATRKQADDEQTRQFARIKSSHDYMKQAAPLLQAIYAKDPAGLLPAFEQVVPEWKQAGATDAGIEQMRKAFQTNPQGAIQALGGMGDVDVVKNGNDTVGVRKGTGDIVWTVKGPAKPPQTVKYREGREEVTDFYDESGAKIRTVRGDVDKPAGEGGMSAAELAGWTLLNDSDGTPYRINIRNPGQGATDLQGRPYTPKSAQRVGTGTPGEAAVRAGRKLYIDRKNGVYFNYNERDPNDKPTKLDGTPYEPEDFTPAPTLSAQSSAANRTLDPNGNVNTTLNDLQRANVAADANARAAATAANRAPPKPYRVMEGNDFVTYGYDPGTKQFKEVARAPRSVNDVQAEPISDEALKTMAESYLSGGPIPPFGTGANAANNRNRFYGAINALTKSAGKTGVDVAADRADFAANRLALNRTVAQQSAIRQFERTTMKNADLVLEMGAKGVGPSNIPLFNAWVQGGRRAFGSPEVRNFDQTLTTFLNEYARVMQGQTGAGGTTDTARTEALGLIRSSDNWETVKSSIALLKREMKNREDALEEEVQARRGTLRGKGLGVIQPDETTLPGGWTVKVKP